MPSGKESSYPKRKAELKGKAPFYLYYLLFLFVLFPHDPQETHFSSSILFLAPA